MKNIIAISATIVILAGCATAKVASPEVQAAALAPLYCDGAEQCARYWRRAQIWVTNNSRWKIQTVTDAVIVTYTPPRSEVSRGFQITREPLSEGREQIKIASACANMFGCDTDAHRVALDFKNYVKATQ